MFSLKIEIKNKCKKYFMILFKFAKDLAASKTEDKS